MFGKAYATSCGITPRKVKTLAGRLRLMSNGAGVWTSRSSD